MHANQLRHLSHKKRSLLPRAVSEACKSGGVYQAPAAGQSVDALQPLTIQWDPSCLTDTPTVDIHLYALKASNSVIHTFTDVDFASGSLEADIKPRWWNSNSSVELSLGIVPSGLPSFMNELPIGPTFFATYSPPTDGSVPAAADTSISENDDRVSSANPVGAAKDQGGLSPGRTAAAVVVPLLVAIALAVGAYLWVVRKRRTQKSNRFSQALDKRMSTISSDWKSITPAGAHAAIRASMAPQDRPVMYEQDNSARFSTFSYSNRPVSSVNAVEGSRGLYSHDNSTISNFDYINGYNSSPTPRSQPTNVMRPSFTQSRVSFADQPAHLRQSRISFAEGTRQSRVSFADGTRPSVDSRRSIYSTNTSGERASRAFHFNVTPDAPPVPIRKLTDDSGSGANELLSPKQQSGALPLSQAEINSKASNMTNEDEDVGAAITYIRSNDVTTDVLFAVPPTPNPAAMPSPPAAVYSPALGSGTTGVFAAQQDSPVPVSPLGPMPMLPAGSQPSASPAKYMSPDDMLRAYAEGKRNGATTSSGMRQLYTSDSSPPNSATPMMRQASQTQQYNSSWEGDAYDGRA